MVVVLLLSPLLRPSTHSAVLEHEHPRHRSQLSRVGLRPRIALLRCRLAHVVGARDAAPAVRRALLRPDSEVLAEVRVQLALPEPLKLLLLLLLLHQRPLRWWGPLLLQPLLTTCRSPRRHA